MEQTTLQQRIEERAKERLLKKLRDAYEKETEIADLIGAEYPRTLLVRIYYGNGRKEDTYEVDNEFTQKVYDRLLPNFIQMVTDEILHKIDEIDYLVNSKELQEDLP